jgi:tetratricopeptide (TPR) repeat protein
MISQWKRIAPVVASFLVCLAFSGLSLCQDAPPASQPKRVQLNFPTSGSADAQKIFLKGVELLHNFEYDDAVETFRGAIKAHPDFAMAYWGLAMSYNHPLWGEQDIEAARHALADLDKAQATRLTAYEKGFIAAVRLLYGDGDKTKRDAAYAEAMRQLYVQYPNDDEVGSFYGLAILGTKAENENFLVNVKASDVLERVYSRNPNHPGVLHYLVHCYDDPRFASLGRQAADRYGQVAPDSAHALHMPSHIYLDLGMWKEFVQVNQASWVASLDRVRRDNLGPGGYDIHGLHTLQWLEYGYLQQGQIAKAMDSLKAMAKIYAANPDPMVKWYLAMMRASYIVNAVNWKDIQNSADLKNIESMDLQGVELTAPANNMFATGLAAARQNRPEDVKRAIDDIGAMVKNTQHATQDDASQADTGHHHDSFFTSSYASSIKPAQVMKSQLEALQLLAAGKIEDAINQLQTDVGDEEKLPVGYGPPAPVKPSAELLGEVYLRAGHPQSAMRAFQWALLRYPKRAASLVGLSEAARLAGDRETSAKADEELSGMQLGAAGRFEAWKQLPCRACPAQR